MYVTQVYSHNSLDAWALNILVEATHHVNGTVGGMYHPGLTIFGVQIPDPSTDDMV